MPFGTSENNQRTHAHLRTFTDESSLALPTAHSRGRGRREYPAYNRPMHKTDIAVKIVPSDDAAYTVVNAGDQIWRKRYSTMLSATSEAVELEIMTPSDKGLADMSQPVPTYAQGFSAPSVEVDIDELIRRGFQPDA
jgi:hypothetical protein